MRVNLCHAGGSQLVRAVFGCLFLCAFGSQAQDKIIRLRNETIATPPKSATALQPLAVEAPASVSNSKFIVAAAVPAFAAAMPVWI